ncbi:glycosyltransferase family 2 protein [uncultured Sulfurimonas sp.]|mgnify:CR=1 FL=1|uniref:glycosyltransferase family 2 protein n=1 Tax=uncultured Sulfurimonas sp. TaxID=291845 RepID=UPI0032B1BB11
MKVSIITVSFNSEKTIERTIKSVIKQTYSEIEYIIIDGASTDNTLNIINKYKKNINILISEKDNGIYDAMNKGIKVATGEILHFLNSDDYYIDDSPLETVISQFGENKEVVISPVKMVDTEENFLYDFSSNINDPFKCIPHQGFYYKKTLHDTYGMYSLFLKYASDYNFYLRLRKSNINTIEISEPTVCMQEGGAGVSEGLLVLCELFYVQVRNNLSFFKAFRKFIFLLLRNRIRVVIENIFISSSIYKLRFYFRKNK